MDKRDFYFKQLVTAEELDAAFDGAETADRALASDMGLFGIKTGGVVSEHSPVANLTVDLDNETDPFIAYDALGSRLYSAASQNIDVSVDEFGNSTTVGTVGHERWLALFARFVRAESDPRVDGNGNAVNFVQNEAVEFFVRRGASAAIGSAALVTLSTEFVLLADIKITNGDTAVNTAAISTTRRQDFVYVGADRIGVDPDDLAGQTIVTGVNVGECLGEIANALEDHIHVVATQHSASQISVSADSWIDAGTLQEVVNNIVDGLGSTVSSQSGAAKIGIEDLGVGTANYNPAAGDLKTLLALMHSELVRVRRLVPVRFYDTIHTIPAATEPAGSLVPGDVDVYLGTSEPSFVSIVDKTDHGEAGFLDTDIRHSVVRYNADEPNPGYYVTVYNYNTLTAMDARVTAYRIIE